MSARVLYQYYSSTFVSLTSSYFQEMSAYNYHDVTENFVLLFNYDHEQNYHLSQRTARSTPNTAHAHKTNISASALRTHNTKHSSSPQN
jgi:hypothetical protein